jgi:hypothetical protein
VQYSTPKYKALEYYLEKQTKKIEYMLSEHLEEIYKEQVPKEVQEYVKSQNPDDEEQKENKPIRRQSSRMKAEEVTDAPIVSGPKLSM